MLPYTPILVDSFGLLALKKETPGAERASVTSLAGGSAQISPARASGRDEIVAPEFVYLRQNKLPFLVGHLGLMPLAMGATWDFADQGRMLGVAVVQWIAVAVVWFMFNRAIGLAGSRPHIPASTVAAAAAVELPLSCLLFFVPASASDPVFVYFAASALLSITVIVVVTIGPISAMLRWSLIALLLPFAASLIAFGWYIEAGATIFFLGAVGILAHRGMHSAFRELHELRLLASRQASEAELAASTDVLTGLMNRYGVQQLAAGYPPGVVAGLFIDLDHFKQVNDTLGHGAGDELLQIVAKRLRATLRPGSVIVRLGGDEFLVLLDEHDRIAVEAIATRLVQAIEAPMRLADDLVHVSASVGLALHRGDFDLRVVLSETDRALYSAKSAGRGRWAWADQPDTDPDLLLQAC